MPQDADDDSLSDPEAAARAKTTRHPPCALSLRYYCIDSTRAKHLRAWFPCAAAPSLTSR